MSIRDNKRIRTLSRFVLVWPASLVFGYVATRFLTSSPVPRIVVFVQHIGFGRSREPRFGGDAKSFSEQDYNERLFLCYVLLNCNMTRS